MRIDCESCMRCHIEQAAASVARCEEVCEEVGVDIEMGGGPATVSTHLALEAIEEVYG